MALYLVLLSTILAFSLTSTEQYVSSLDSMKNASGHSITRVNTVKESPRLLSENVHQTEQIVPVHDISMSGAVQPPAASTTTTTTPKSCPHSGYQLYPGFNCYKAFPSQGEIKTWSEAREQCMRDGGDLMVIETERERKEVYIPLYNNGSFYFLPWVGVYIPEDGNEWSSVKGEPALSTWWYPGEPVKDDYSNCALADSNGLLWNYMCPGSWPFICEISL